MQWMILIWLSLVFAQEKTNENRKTVLNIDTELEFTPESSKDEECECVPFFQCNNEYGEDVIKLRMDEIKCDVFGHVCCPFSSVENQTESTPVMGEECGLRNLGKIDYRISGTNNEASLGEFPWMVAIMLEGTNKGIVYKCGGSLIHPRVVLTAAHCVVRSKVQQMKIRAGDVELHTPKSSSSQDRKVQKIITHEKFNIGSGFNDIAILILESPFELSKNVGLICLEQNNTTLNKSCIVTGWGTDTKDGELQQLLRLVEFPMVPRDQCQDLLRKNLNQNFELHESFLCAGGIRGADSCKGDGGSPLICPVKDGKDMQYEQVGIVSWGVDCATETPGVYTYVALYTDWVKDQMNKNLYPR